MDTMSWPAVTDLGIATTTAVAWFVAAVTLHRGRRRTFGVLVVVALILTLLRGGSTAWLYSRGGWWLVQETAVLSLPLLAAAVCGVLCLAGEALLRAMLGATHKVSRFRVVLTLFAAGYASAAGPIVTVLSGAPVRTSTVVIAVSAVVGAVALTGLIIHPNPPPYTTPKGLTRRRMLGVTGAVAMVSGVTGSGLTFLPVPRLHLGGGDGGDHVPEDGTAVTDLRGPDVPIPGGSTHQHVITAAARSVPLSSGYSVNAWTYDGTLPGPTIDVHQGDLLEVTLRNGNIENGVTLHWHGYEIACGEDGVPGVTQEPVMPGEEFTYRFRADNPGTYWYHTHDAAAVRRGLYGCFVVRGSTLQEPDEPEDQDFIVPVHTFDGRVVIGDSDNVREEMARPDTPVRLRLINTDSRPHWFSLLGASFRVVAVDGRDINEPGERAQFNLRIPAGGRYDLTFTMPEDRVSLLVDHDLDAGLRVRPEGMVGRTLPDTTDDSRAWPDLDLHSYGEPTDLPFDPEGAFDREFDLVMDRRLVHVSGTPTYSKTVNGYTPPNIPTQLVDVRDLVLMTVVNRSFELRPWYLHGHSVYVVRRDGEAPTGSPIARDTFDVRPGEVWVVAFRAMNPGLWVNDCVEPAHGGDWAQPRLDYTGIYSPFDSQ
ncbi:multicopper oxidase domain-containing protein [Spiractinospora alimapuensis]|uniref:multicopper oxidase family protein n=1 Tax=Spiractinospora alimapuensis TaxID=2820884 RepID=UPI001F344C92|nr:multicopper oxidase family protein [Spiractinospora alimapuensis]QVQ53431.1 multicopper oxidase domain-containing protein [Spiractinospora alimapuensis]